MNWNEHLRYEDGKLFWKIPRQRRNMSKQVGVLHKIGYLMFGFDYKNVYVHRVVWEMHNGQIPDGFEIDHIDRNRSNNKIENLRLATPQQNQRNKSSNGFHWLNSRKCFRARININMKEKHLGCYDNIIDARAAYLMARREYFGEFA